MLVMATKWSLQASETCGDVRNEQQRAEEKFTR